MVASVQQMAYDLNRLFRERWASTWPDRPLPEFESILHLANSDQPLSEDEPQIQIRALVENLEESCRVLLILAQASPDSLHARRVSDLMFEVARCAHGRDSLTGLLDHSSSWSALQREWDRARRHDRQMTLMVIDIANFKQVNDTIGHLNGDKLLVRIADLLLRNTRSEDIVGRIGGDEFLVVLTETGVRSAHEMMRRLRVHIGPWRRNGLPEGFDLSYGVSSFDPESPQVMFQTAESQLYMDRGKELKLDAVQQIELPQVRILIVEDDFALAGFMREVLLQRGYDVAVQHSLAQAREALESDQTWDLMLLDLHLPDGRGFDLLADETLTDGIPVVVTTGQQQEGPIAQAADLGVLDYLVKPFSAQELERAVAQALVISGVVEHDSR